MTSNVSEWLFYRKINFNPDNIVAVNSFNKGIPS